MIVEPSASSSFVRACIFLPPNACEQVLLNAVSASEAFESFLRDENSTLLLSNRYLLPEDYINADCECKSADCRQDVSLFF